MTALDDLTALIGTWRGTKRLWLAPGEPVRESESGAEIATVAQGQFSELRYTWAYEGEPQEGRLIVGRGPADGAVQAVWFDTWHMRDQFMVCEGESPAAGSRGEDAAEGAVTVRGSYAAPPGPDWGWEIAIEPRGPDGFRLRMTNITPEGERFLAVEIGYARQS
jgi:hypothetical protein